MTPERFDQLLAKVEPFILHQSTHRIPITAAERLALTLRLLATGDSQQSIAFAYRMGRRTVNGIFRETCIAIWEALHEEYMKPPTECDWKIICRDFWILWNFPMCVGAIDGKHVIIKAPPASGSRYFNYKSSHSVVLLAVADANYKFVMIDVGGFGRQSDGGTFSNSSFGEYMESNKLDLPQSTNLPGTNIQVPHVFLGDEAFPLKVNLLRPFPGRDLTKERRIFNYRLSRARRVIENAFGILAARWRIFRKPIEATPDTVDCIIKAACILHNYLKTTDYTNPVNARYAPTNFVDYEIEPGQVNSGEWRNIVDASASGAFQNGRLGGNFYSNTASETRQKFLQFFNSSEGSVPWQDSVCNRGKEAN